MRLYLELQRWRDVRHVLRSTEKGMMSGTVPAVLTLADVANWVIVTGREIDRFELSVLSKLETAFWAVQHGRPATVEPDQQEVVNKVREGLRSMMKAQAQGGSMRTIQVKKGA